MWKCFCDKESSIHAGNYYKTQRVIKTHLTIMSILDMLAKNSKPLRASLVTHEWNWILHCIHQFS